MNPLVYVVYGIVAVFLLGSLGLGAFIYLSSRPEVKPKTAKGRRSKKAAAEDDGIELDEIPEVSVAARIREKFADSDSPQVSYGVDGKGGYTPVIKKSRSVFSFSTSDDEDRLNFSEAVGEESSEEFPTDR